MKKLLIVFAAVLLIGCKADAPKQESGNTTQGCDAFDVCEEDSFAIATANFKEAYEALNGKTNASGKLHRTIHLPKNHPFVETDLETVQDMLKSGLNFYLYIGDEMCPWCRAVIETAAEKAIKYSANEVLYLPIWDEDGNEILRDKYELQDGKPVLVSEGTEGYQELLKCFDEVLTPYTLSDNDTEIEVGEKRIYAPSFFRIIGGGREVYMTTGIPEDLTDPRAELSEDQEKEIADQFDEFFKAGSLVNVK